MSDAEALRAAIAASPDDPLSALVYADFLDDHGYAGMAARLRLDVNRGGVLKGTYERAGLRAPMTLVWGQELHQSVTLLGLCNKWGQIISFSQLSWWQWEQYGDLLMATQPLRDVLLDDMPPLRVVRNDGKNTVTWMLAHREDIEEVNSFMELGRVRERRYESHRRAIARQLLLKSKGNLPIWFDFNRRPDAWLLRNQPSQEIPWGGMLTHDMVMTTDSKAVTFTEWAAGRERVDGRWVKQESPATGVASVS